MEVKFLDENNSDITDAELKNIGITRPQYNSMKLAVQNMKLGIASPIQRPDRKKLRQYITGEI